MVKRYKITQARHSFIGGSPVFFAAYPTSTLRED